VEKSAKKAGFGLKTAAHCKDIAAKFKVITFIIYLRLRLRLYIKWQSCSEQCITILCF